MKKLNQYGLISILAICFIEAIFLNEFMKQARKAKLAEDILGSDAQDTYLEMMDRELSTQLAGRVNLGIAEALVRQFGGVGES